MERQYMCVNRDCHNITSDCTTLKCSRCGSSLLIIPKKLDNDLFQAINSVVLDYYDLETFLSNAEDLVEVYGFTKNERLTKIRDWKDFKRFFGNQFYRMYYPIYGRGDSTE